MVPLVARYIQVRRDFTQGMTDVKTSSLPVYFYIQGATHSFLLLRPVRS